MIWQLIKVDVAWRMAPFVMLFALAFAALPGGVVFSILLVVAGGAAGIQQQETLFQSSLPISGHHILIARTLSTWALLWLPLAICGPILTLIPHSGVSASTVLILGSVCTLVLVCLQAIRVQRTFIAWLLLTPFVIGMACAVNKDLRFIVTKYLSQLSQIGTPAVSSIVVITWLCIAAVSLVIWRTATVVLPVYESEKAAVAISSAPFITNPLARMVLSLSWLAVAWLAIGLILGLGLNSGWSGALLGLPFSQFRSMRPKIAWLRNLPVSPNSILATLLLPALILLAVGYEIGIHRQLNNTPVPIPRQQILRFTVIAAGLMLSLLIAMLGDWRRINRFTNDWVAPKIAGAIILSFMLSVAVLVWHTDLAQSASDILPANLPATIVIAFLPLVAIYRAIAKVFSQLELVTPVVNRK